MSNGNINVEVCSIELSDEELSEVSAGKYDAFAHIGDIKGESVEHNHKDWIT